MRSAWITLGGPGAAKVDVLGEQVGRQQQGRAVRRAHGGRIVARSEEHAAAPAPAGRPAEEAHEGVLPQR